MLAQQVMSSRFRENTPEVSEKSRRGLSHARPERDSVRTALTNRFRRAQKVATGSTPSACLSTSAVEISVRRRSIRSSTVRERQMSALTHAVISASRVRASLPAISTPASSLGQPAARCSRQILASCIRFRCGPDAFRVRVFDPAPFLPRPWPSCTPCRAGIPGCWLLEFRPRNAVAIPQTYTQLIDSEGLFDCMKACCLPVPGTK